jgi:Skp family chaperone for outer membrane proteins
MAEAKPVNTDRAFEELKAEHLRALKAQDVETLQKVQAKLDVLMACGKRT